MKKGRSSSINTFANCRLTTKTTLEIEKLRRHMYQQYLETNDPKALVAISQELDQAINTLYLSETTRVT